jgi:hypothetical protein
MIRFMVNLQSPISPFQRFDAGEFQPYLSSLTQTARISKCYTSRQKAYFSMITLSFKITKARFEAMKIRKRELLDRFCHIYSVQ